MDQSEVIETLRQEFEQRLDQEKRRLRREFTRRLQAERIRRRREVRALQQERAGRSLLHPLHLTSI